MNEKEFLNIKKNFEKIFPQLSEIEVEKTIEILFDTSNYFEFSELENWYESQIKNLKVVTNLIDIQDCEGWNLDENSNIQHNSGKFFKIKGVKIFNSENREVGTKGWNQPILIENNLDGGILGLIRTYINGTPHYLIEAKYEPGNFNKIQLSPTLQATFSNLSMVHGGKRPNYAEYFDDYEKSKNSYIFNQWLSEDGGRFFEKRNRGLVKHIAYEEFNEIPENFVWLSLFQLRKALKEKTIVNPHLARLIYLF